MNDSTGSTGKPRTAATAPTSRRCHFCGGASLRRSRLRAFDFPWLLVLHWPVRCRRCSKRQFVFLTDARRIIAASTPHTPEQLAQDSWQNFTANESPALRSDKHEGER
jgi:hypothetical protein